MRFRLASVPVLEMSAVSASLCLLYEWSLYLSSQTWATTDVYQYLQLLTGFAVVSFGEMAGDGVGFAGIWCP